MKLSDVEKTVLTGMLMEGKNVFDAVDAILLARAAGSGLEESVDVPLADRQELLAALSEDAAETEPEDEDDRLDLD